MYFSSFILSLVFAFLITGGMAARARATPAGNSGGGTAETTQESRDKGLNVVLGTLALPRDTFYRARSMDAFRILSAPVIDGRLDEACWRDAPLTQNFTTTQPDPGKPSMLQSIIRVVYDDQALYIGAHLVDPNPDSVQVTLSRRDEFGNADWFGVMLSPYRDGSNAFSFSLTAAGVQIDEKWTGTSTDVLWDAVWESAVWMDEDGWYAEIALPYGALRFPSGEEQDWGINFARSIRRTREESWWSPVDVAEKGLIQQVGLLQGLENIKAPFRLSLSPYVSSFVEVQNNPETGTRQTVGDFAGGMDLKYGINDAFTLDMTLIPDFNQVRFDNEVLNLSPFEVRFNENRAFFTEGTELFNKQDLFYSRRIGGRPIGFFDAYNQVGEGEELLSNPRDSRLYNATKVSGRTEGGLGIGVFNAVTAETQAIIRGTDGEERGVTTAPLTNYNVFVLDQNLNRANSFVTFTNTSVWRSGEWEDANVSGLLFSLRDKKDRYQIETSGALSQEYLPDTSAGLGHTAGFEFSKVSGQFTFSAGYNEESNTYNPNDLGFLGANNTRSWSINTNYNIYKPFWRFNQLYHYLGANYLRNYAPDGFFNLGFYSEATQIWKSFFASGIWMNAEPIITYDWFEPRVPGRFLEYPINYNWGSWISSDYRKKLAIDVESNYRWFNADNRENFNYEISPRWRVNDKMLLIVSYGNYFSGDDLGWVNQVEDEIILGRRDVQTAETGLEANYIFTNRMFLTLRVRHYWSKAEYAQYYALGEDGRRQETSYDGIDVETGQSAHNVNFNAFTVDAAFTWRFAPGSDLFLVWKEGIFDSGSELERNYFSNLERTFRSAQSNNLSLRVVYFVDYVQWKKWTRKEQAAEDAQTFSYRNPAMLTHGSRRNAADAFWHPGAPGLR